MCWLAVPTLFFIALALGGCGETQTRLDYDTSPSKPVVTYETLQTIAPVYNPDVPVTVVYGDGSVLKKEGPYSLVTGKAEPGVGGVLESLDEKGFFRLDREYRGEPRAGGVTEVMTVNLTDRKYEVSVEGGEGPAEWRDIIDTVKDVELLSPVEYIPEAVTLFAGAGAPPPGAENVYPWPGAGDDLAGAAEAGSDGLPLRGEEAGVAWKAIQRGSKNQGDVYWKAGDAYYTYVYASPVLPGIPEK